MPLSLRVGSAGRGSGKHDRATGLRTTPPEWSCTRKVLPGAGGCGYHPAPADPPEQRRPEPAQTCQCDRPLVLGHRDGEPARFPVNRQAGSAIAQGARGGGGCRQRRPSAKVHEASRAMRDWDLETEVMKGRLTNLINAHPEQVEGTEKRVLFGTEAAKLRDEIKDRMRAENPHRAPYEEAFGPYEQA